MRPFNLILFWILLLPPLFSAAQNEANIWYFGNNAGMDFNGGAPVALTNGILNTVEGCATICDPTTGALLFYTDGVTVWTRNHTVMPNGTGLLGHTSSTQSAIIVPRPGSNRYYYIFTTPNILGPGGLTYSEVDMTLNSGFGDVTALKNITLNATNPEKVTAACHANGTDYWVLTHDWNNNNWLAYAVTSTGINTTPVTSSSGVVLGGTSLNSLGQLKISPDGSRVAHCTWTFNTLEVGDFNNATGVVSNVFSLPHSGEEYGTAFSPDGSKLYFASCCFNPNGIYQFDLSSGVPATIAASKTTIWNGTPSIGKGSMQLGPDGKIYCSILSSPFLGVINNPDLPGTSCNYVNNGFNLGGRTSQIGLPNFVPCLVVVLPFEFSAFYASTTEDLQVQLHWEGINQETDGVHEVERSRDGAYFYKIGEVEVPGMEKFAISGDFLDPDPLAGVNYYRIAANSANGERIVSEVVTVIPDDHLLSDFQASPNPVVNQLNIKLEVLGNQSEIWRLKVLNSEGKKVHDEELGELQPGTFHHKIEVKEWSAGVYFVHLRSGPYLGIKKIMVAE